MPASDFTSGLTAENLADRVNAYWQSMQAKFGNQNENDRSAYFDTFKQFLAGSVDSNVADKAVNGNGFFSYLWSTIKGGVAGSAADINKKLPNGNQVTVIAVAVGLLAVVVLLKR